MLALFLFYVMGGLFLALLSLPLIARKIPPNPLYGFRIQQTLEDPAVWYAVNAYFARRLLVASMVFVVSAVVCYFVPGISLDAYALLCLAVFVVAFTVAIFQSVQYLKKFHD